MGYGDNNLFNPELTTGDLSKIKPIVRVVQTISVWIISIIGLSITISTILKQATHGLYATNPQFWDKVDEIHRQKMGATVDRGGNQIQILIGFGLAFFFSMIPNIKAITEFDGDTIDPKTFFTKSLPMSCLYLFIGVFIFYGYTTKVGEKVSMFGTELLDNFFLQIDPLEWAARIPTTFAKVNLSTSGSKADFDKEVNDVTKKAYSALKTNLDDITKEKQPQVALEVESWVIECLENHREYTNTDEWSLSFNARTTPGFSDLDKVHNSHSDDNREWVFAYQKALADFSTGTANPNVDTNYLRIDMTFTKKSTKDNTAAITCNMAGGKYSSGTKEGVVDLGASTAEAALIGSLIEGGVDGKAVNIIVNGSKLTIKPKNSGDKLPDKITEITGINGLKYSFGGKTHPVKSITINGDQGTSIKFTPTDATSVEPWNWGTGPQNKTGDNKATKGSNENSDDDNESEETESNKNDLIG